VDLTVQLDELLNHKPGYLHWSALNFYFKENENKLTDEQKRRIFYRCENYREQHNKENLNDNIGREDTSPNIYEDLSYLEENTIPEANDVPLLAAITI